MNTLEAQQAPRIMSENRLKWNGHELTVKSEHYSEKNATHPMEKKKRASKHKVDRCLQERYDRGGAGSGQHNKHGGKQ